MIIIAPVAPDEDTEGGREAAGEEAQAGQARPRHADWAAAVSGDQGPDHWPGEAVHTYPGVWTHPVTSDGELTIYLYYYRILKFNFSNAVHNKRSLLTYICLNKSV